MWNVLRWGAAVLVVAVVNGPQQILPAAEPPRSPPEWLQWFSQNWSEEAWMPKEGGRFSRSIRPLDDKGWQARVRTLQALVAGGQDSVAPLVKALGEGTVPERILAAQTLGFLAPHASREALLKAAGTDADAAVRLHAIDSLGMLGIDDSAAEIAALAKAEGNRDVKRHLGYLSERKGQAIEPQIVRDLVNWDAGRINTAQVGQPAPDFELTSLTGERIRLSQYRGQKAVVLVFIYGDT